MSSEMSIFFEILVRTASYGPKIDQSHDENRLNHIIMYINCLNFIVVDVVIVCCSPRFLCLLSITNRVHVTIQILYAEQEHVK